MKYQHIEYDCLIFDVDNVLIETSLSFPWVIRTTIQYSWKNFLRAEVDGIPFTWEHFRAMKEYPYFNDDYDIAWILLNMAASKKHPSLANSFPSVDELHRALGNYHGEALEEWIDRVFGIAVSRKRVRKLCAELYYGEDIFMKITGKEPAFVKCKGFWQRERPLLKRHWSELHLPVGIYTGRFYEELQLAMKLLKWEDFPKRLTVTADSGVVKPSSEGLSRICSELGAESPLYFGDAESDRKSLENLGFGNFIAIGDVVKGSPLRFDNLQIALAELGV